MPLSVSEYHLNDPRWTLPPIRITVLSDLHVGTPGNGLPRLKKIVAQANALGSDLIVLAGDYLMDRNQRIIARPAEASAIAAELVLLSAPLGVHAILGNHDWTDCDLARDTGQVRNSVVEAFDAAGLSLLRNSAVTIPHGAGFWLAGTDSQRAIKTWSHETGTLYTSYHDADAAFADAPQGAPAILLAHEPDCFAEADPRAFLQISGHTHGGQIKLFGRTPMVPSDYGSRYVGGHIREAGRHLIVSRGIGTSGPPLRVGVPPEIVLIHIRGEEENPYGGDRHT